MDEEKILMLASWGQMSEEDLIRELAAMEIDKMYEELLIVLGSIAADEAHKAKVARREKREKEFATLLQESMDKAEASVKSNGFIVETRQCSVCGEVKSLADFPRAPHKNKHTGQTEFHYWKYCKACRSVFTSARQIERYAQQAELRDEATQRLDAIKEQQRHERTCKICMITKPITEFSRDKRIVKHTGEIRHEKVCKACRYTMRREQERLDTPPKLVNEATNIIPPLIMNPNKPEDALIDIRWLLDPADEKYWELNPTARAQIEALMNLPVSLVNHLKPEDCLPIYNEAKQLKEGDSDVSNRGEDV